jgi:hypothetical protein
MACSSISDGSGRLVELSGFGRWHAVIVPSLDASRALSDVRRILAGFFALTWFIVPGFGLIDLSVTWDPVWLQVIEAGWGLYMRPFVGIPFTTIAVCRRVPVVAAAQLYVAARALIVPATPAFEWQLVVLAAVIVVETVIVTALPSLRRLGPPPLRDVAPLVGSYCAWVIPGCCTP